MVDFHKAPYPFKECKILPHAQLVELLKKYRAGDKEALEELIKSQLRLAYQLVDRLGNEELYDDLVAQAHSAILHAINKWDPEKGRLSTITTIVVRQFLLKYLQNMKYVIRVPPNIQKAQRKLMDEGEKNFSSLRCSRLHSLNAIINMEYLGTTVNPKKDAEYYQKQDLEVLEEEQEKNKILEKCKDYIEKLDDKGKSIIKKYFGLDGEKYTLKQLAQEYNCTIGQIRKEISNIINKLRNII